MSDYAIKVDRLTKKFNGFTAVNGISFAVRKGELFGLLGPNGAGKSTTIYMLTTLLEPNAGMAQVNGFDIVKQAEKVRESIGIVFQDATVDTRLTAYDNLDIHGRLYGMNVDARKTRIQEVLELVELTDWRDKMVKTFSGGMRRRLEIARGLMHTPKILFLDEPTLGLDPQTRRHIWSYIEKLRTQGITIILTTHYLEEADYLCEQVAIIDQGKIVVLDTPRNLKAKMGGSIISIKTRETKKLCELLSKKNMCKDPRISEIEISFKAENGGKLIPKIMEIAQKAGIDVEGIEMHVPSLEDVYIHYTGSKIREEKAGGSEMTAMRRFHGH
ncbi:ATP-binding cassette domain-containing protein [Candidatus Micrarchaeota archaeon]|nr:ATP-binding cassette domain-containing protein [Candidatus Micrarchaeota archaeon]